MERLETIAMEKIHPDPDQPREYFDEVKMAELTASIGAVGLKTPIKVYEHPDIKGEYKILYGERRFLAHKNLEMSEIKCHVVDPPEVKNDNTFVEQFLENVVRADMTVMEEARGAKRYVENGHSVEFLASAAGKSVATIQADITLCSLPPDIQREIDGKVIPKTIGHKLAEFPDQNVYEAWRRVRGKKNAKDMINALTVYRNELGQTTLFDYNKKMEIVPETKKMFDKFEAWVNRTKKVLNSINSKENLEKIVKHKERDLNSLENTFINLEKTVAKFRKEMDTCREQRKSATGRDKELKVVNG